MEITINENNLQLKEIDEFQTKVRTILINESQEILIANYGNIILLPGGKIDKNENIIDALKRELLEELGIHYNNNELTYLTTINQFQKNYPKRNGTTKHRLIKTYYYFAEYKGIIDSKQHLTEKEQKDNFKLELIPLNELESLITKNLNNNPRNIYFQQELLTILNYYLTNKEKTKILKPRD